MADEQPHKQVFKDMLTQLYETFPEESNEHDVYKSVARLEKKVTKLLDFVSDPSKFNFEVRFT